LGFVKPAEWVGREGVDTVVASIPKVGSHSIQKAVMWCQEGIRISPDEALKRDLRVLFIRHPITRVRSTFSMFRAITKDKQRSTLVPLESVYIKGRGVIKDYEAFIDHVLSEAENPHWNSQIEMVTHNNIFIPNRIHRFEDIEREWPQYGFSGALPWENAWLREETSDYRLDDLSEKFKADLALWEECGGNRHTD
jgi:hypothetical protein